MNKTLKLIGAFALYCMWACLMLFISIALAPFVIVATLYNKLDRRPDSLCREVPIACFVLSLLLAGSAIAQTSTNSPPPTLWDFVTTGSNYFAVVDGMYSTGDHKVGGGLALGYKATDFFAPVIRLDYFNSQFWMPSLNAQLSVPRQLMGKVPIIPIAIAGAAIPVSGAGANNGTAVGILGAGAALPLDFLGSGKFWTHTDIVFDYEHWSGVTSKQANQWRFGLLYKF